MRESTNFVDCDNVLDEKQIPEYEIYRDKKDLVYVVHTDRSLINTHFHNCIEMIYVESGRLRFTVGGENHEITSRQIMAVSSMLPHTTDSLFSGEKSQLYVLIIPRRYLREYDKVLNENSFATPFTTDEDGLILELFRLLYDISPMTNKPYNARTTFYNFGGNVDKRESALRHACSLLIGIIIEKCGLTPKTRTSAVITRAVEYIESNFRRDVTVAKMAKVLLTNQQELSAQFHNIMGVSITEYISHLRTDEAARLLSADPTLTVDSVRELSGFGSTRSFLRDFRRDFSCTPTEYRSRTAASEKQAE